jgi:DNA-binding SARP family transcriptional activator
MQALTNLARVAWERKAYDECLHYWQRQLAIDNCLEDAHYWIMCCYIRAGKRSLALRQYHQCRETLQRELGTNPGETIEKIYQKQLQRGEQRFQTEKT